MQRSWIEKLYLECGREVSLAYTVLNHTNSWAVTLVAALLASGLVGSVDTSNGKLLVLYPSPLPWLVVILAWIIMLRFFTRSTLALANMFRWNALIKLLSKFLSLPEGHPAHGFYQDRCAKAIDAYYYRWRSAEKLVPLLWRSLKLMYLWLFLLVAVLIVWGAIRLEKDALYVCGMATLATATALEVLWLVRWDGLKHEAIDMAGEPDIVRLWTTGMGSEAGGEPRALLLGFCASGPYAHAAGALGCGELKWLPWSYHAQDIHSELLRDLRAGAMVIGRPVAFAAWSPGDRGTARVLRSGRVDHGVFANETLRLTVLLDDLPAAAGEVELKEGSLCRYK